MAVAVALIWLGLFSFVVRGETSWRDGQAAAAGEVIVHNAAELAEAVRQANLGGPTTILVADGTYSLEDMLWVEAAGVTVRSLSGNRQAVILEGQGMAGDVTHIFNVPGANFTVQDVTLRRVSQHAVQIHGNREAHSPRIRNVHILDTGEQMIKVSYDPDNPDLRSDNGVVENCLLEYSAGVGPQWYIGGVDAHNARNWQVRGNIFRGIRSPADDLAEPAIHFWSGSQDTLVEGNTIINCDRGIGFGLGDRGHIGGIVCNNMIYHNAAADFGDVGISLESAANAQVYNNTVFQEHDYPNAIEYRFSATSGVLIANNLTNKDIAPRDGASGTVSHNVTTAQASWFVNPAAGNLHLQSSIPAVVDQGQIIAGLTTDFDGDLRPLGPGIDIGADEYHRWVDFLNLLLPGD
jgi:hypothetical protein